MQVIIESSVRTLFLATVYAFSVFFWIALDKCVWSMKIILLEPSYFRHSRSISNFLLKYIKSESPKSYSGKKEQKTMFSVLSSSLDARFDFAGPFFMCPIGWASNIASPENQAPWIHLIIHSLTLFQVEKKYSCKHTKKFKY